MRTLLIVLTFLTLSTAIFAQDCDHPDYKALMAIYNATDGANWTNNTNWDDGTGTISCDPCADNWYGVTCETFASGVEVLDLRNNNLLGSLPPEIGVLPWLKELYLSDNIIEGELPESFRLLERLEYLYLDNNRLVGELPQAFCHLPKLKYLSLESNMLSGEIPECIGDTDSIRVLFLNYNNLTGPLPSSIGQLTKLNGLWLHGNQLTGTLPPEWGALNSLQSLNVSDNNLEGCFPSSYASLCGNSPFIPNWSGNNSIALNSISWSSFCSPGGTTAAMHPDYSALVAFYNATNGPFWDDKSNWDNGTASVSCDPCADDWYGIECSEGRVSEMRLVDNNLSGSLPVEIGDLGYLTHLNLFNNQLISGEIPKELGNLADLVYLDLGENDFEGSLPKELGYLGNLSDFYIDDNNLEGCWPKDMYGIKGVANFEMDGNASPTISNSGWAEFLADTLGIVHIDYDPLVSIYKEMDGINWEHDDGWEPYNSCSDPCDDWYGVSCVGNIVTGLDLSDNGLKGIMPDELEELSGLTKLSLVGNEISGEFPGPIRELDKLTNLNIKGNQLTGALPYIMPWPALDTFSVGNNYLSGRVPNFHNSSSWHRLKFVNLQNNFFVGNLSLARLSNTELEFLTVANNYLRGCLYTRAFDYCANYIEVHTHGNISLTDFVEFCNSGTGICSTCTEQGDLILNDDPFDIGHVDISDRIIKSAGRVGVYNKVLLQALEGIELNENFTVDHHADLILIIDDCYGATARQLNTK